MSAEIYAQAYALVKKYLEASTGIEAMGTWLELQTRLPALKARLAQAAPA
jgi:hypothetical protein